MTDEFPHTPEVKPNPAAPIIFARDDSLAFDVLTLFAGRMVPGAIFPVTAKELASLRNPDDMLVLWKD